MSSQFDAYHEWLGIRPEEQPPHHYRLLGVSPFEDQPNVIANAADQRMAHLKSFQAGKHSALSQQLLNEVAAARLCLLKPEKKADYDAKLHELLDRQSAGEDTSTELKGLQELGELLAREAARPTPKAQPKSSNTTLIVAVGGGIALLAVIVGWMFLNRRAPEIAHASKPLAAAPVAAAQAKAESGKPKAENSQRSAASGQEQAGSRQMAVGSGQNAQPQAPRPKTQHPAASGQQSAVSSQGIVGSGQMAVSGTQSLASSSQDPRPKTQDPIPNPSPAPSPQPLAPLPVPDDTVIAAAMKTAMEIYKEEYDKAQSPAALQALSKKVLQKAGEIQSDAGARYVFLRLARDIAAKAGDQETTFAAIEQMAERFAIDPWAMKAAFITGLAKQARVMNDHKAVAKQALAVMREAQSHDAINVAEELGKLALAEGGKARDKETLVAAREATKQIEQAAKAYKKVEAALAVLKEKPDDPDANLLAGRYLCFVRGDWAKGLPMLAKGADETLKALAAKEMAVGSRQTAAGSSTSPAPSSSPLAPPLALADAWWDLAQQADSKEKDSMLLRAGYWYQRAGTESDTELVRMKIEKRLEAIAKLGRAISEPPAGSAAQVIENSIGMKLVLIPAGEFMMGSSREEIAWATQQTKQQGDWIAERIAGEEPRHLVRISRPFYLGVYEVTQAEYQQVSGVNPSAFSAKGKKADKVAGRDTSRHPVETVSWDDAARFCQRLSALPKEAAARRMYRLPTEAEWEYAARAGSTTKWSFGDDPAALGAYAWFKGNSGDMTHPVGQKKPNARGLYDMYGNVVEWCMDWHSQDYYGQSPPNDPTGLPAGSFRVLRGGAYTNPLTLCRSAFRNNFSPAKRAHQHGFRVVCEITVRPAGGSGRVGASGKATTEAAAEEREKPAASSAKTGRRKLDALSKTLTNSIGMQFALIPAGEFMMGSSPEEIERFTQQSRADKAQLERIPAETPQHRVKISRPFYMGVCPVTQAEFQQVMGNNPSNFSAKGKDAGKVAGQDTSRHPVEMVSWDEATEFCRRLSSFPNERTGRRMYGLPTEAEWEYACRAGTTTRWSCGDDEAALLDCAWFGKDSGGMTHPVGEKKPNAWGLYDMYGHVCQWCLDWYSVDYYKASPPSDPTGPNTGTSRVVRGGGWASIASTCRSACRGCYGPSSRNRHHGFRVVIAR